MRLNARTPTAPESASGSGPTTAAATESTAAEASAATRKYARSRAPSGDRRVRHCAESDRPASTHSVRSKTSPMAPGAESGPRPHCRARQMARARPSTRMGRWVRARGSAARASEAAGVCEA